MKMNSILVVAAAASVFCIGCEKQPSAPVTPAAPPAAAPSASPAAPATAPGKGAFVAPAPSTPAAPAGDLGSTISVMNLAFKLPEGWKQAPPSNSMRLAEAVVADPSGDAAKACVAAFSTAGGDVQSNIGRWANQVQHAAGQPLKAETKQRTVAGLPVHTVVLTGTYLGMGDGAPKTDWTLHAAIVETPGGLLFVKMTGPADRMKAIAPAFETMLDSMTKK